MSLLQRKASVVDFRTMDDKEKKIPAVCIYPGIGNSNNTSLRLKTNVFWKRLHLFQSKRSTVEWRNGWRNSDYKNILLIHSYIVNQLMPFDFNSLEFQVAPLTSFEHQFSLASLLLVIWPLTSLITFDFFSFWFHLFS